MERDTKQMVAGIETQVGTLVERYRAIHAEKSALEQQIAVLNSRLEAKENDLQALQNELELTKIAGSAKGGEVEDSKEMRSRINELVREIDRCIALLNK